MSSSSDSYSDDSFSSDDTQASTRLDASEGVENRDEVEALEEEIFGNDFGDEAEPEASPPLDVLKNVENGDEIKALEEELFGDDFGDEAEQEPSPHLDASECDENGDKVKALEDELFGDDFGDEPEQEGNGSATFQHLDSTVATLPDDEDIDDSEEYTNGPTGLKSLDQELFGYDPDDDIAEKEPQPTDNSPTTTAQVVPELHAFSTEDDTPMHHRPKMADLSEAEIITIMNEGPGEFNDLEWDEFEFESGRQPQASNKPAPVSIVPQTKRDTQKNTLSNEKNKIKEPPNVPKEPIRKDVNVSAIVNNDTPPEPGDVTFVDDGDENDSLFGDDADDTAVDSTNGYEVENGFDGTQAQTESTSGPDVYALDPTQVDSTSGLKENALEYTQAPTGSMKDSEGYVFDAAQVDLTDPFQANGWNYAEAPARSTNGPQEYFFNNTQIGSTNGSQRNGFNGTRAPAVSMDGPGECVFNPAQVGSTNGFKANGLDYTKAQTTSTNGPHVFDPTQSNSMNGSQENGLDNTQAQPELTNGPAGEEFVFDFAQAASVFDFQENGLDYTQARTGSTNDPGVFNPTQIGSMNGSQENGFNGTQAPAASMNGPGEFLFNPAQVGSTNGFVLPNGLDYTQAQTASTNGRDVFNPTQSNSMNGSQENDFKGTQAPAVSMNDLADFVFDPVQAASVLGFQENGWDFTQIPADSTNLDHQQYNLNNTQVDQAANLAQVDLTGSTNGLSYIQAPAISTNVGPQRYNSNNVQVKQAANLESTYAVQNANQNMNIRTNMPVTSNEENRWGFNQVPAASTNVGLQRYSQNNIQVDQAPELAQVNLTGSTNGFVENGTSYTQAPANSMNFGFQQCGLNNTQVDQAINLEPTHAVQNANQNMDIQANMPVSSNEENGWDFTQVPAASTNLGLRQYGLNNTQVDQAANLAQPNLTGSTNGFVDNGLSYTQAQANSTNFGPQQYGLNNVQVNQAAKLEPIHAVQNANQNTNILANMSAISNFISARRARAPPPDHIRSLADVFINYYQTSTKENIAYLNGRLEELVRTANVPPTRAVQTSRPASMAMNRSLGVASLSNTPAPARQPQPRPQPVHQTSAATAVQTPMSNWRSTPMSTQTLHSQDEVLPAYNEFSPASGPLPNYSAASATEQQHFKSQPAGEMDMMNPSGLVADCEGIQNVEPSSFVPGFDDQNSQFQLWQMPADVTLSSDESFTQFLRNKPNKQFVDANQAHLHSPNHGPPTAYVGSQQEFLQGSSQGGIQLPTLPTIPNHPSAINQPTPTPQPPSTPAKPNNKRKRSGQGPGRPRVRRKVLPSPALANSSIAPSGSSVAMSPGYPAPELEAPVTPQNTQTAPENHTDPVNMFFVNSLIDHGVSCTYQCLVTGDRCGATLSGRDKRNRYRHLATHAQAEENLVAEGHVDISQTALLTRLSKLVVTCPIPGCDFRAEVWRTDKIREQHERDAHPDAYERRKQQQKRRKGDASPFQ